MTAVIYTVQPQLIQISDEEDGRELVERCVWMGVTPSAILCVNEALAVTTIRVLNAYGIRVPHHVSVVGVGKIGVAETHGIDLCTYNILSAEWFSKLDKLLWQHIRNPDKTPQRTTLRTKMTHGQTIGPCADDTPEAWSGP